MLLLDYNQSTLYIIGIKIILKQNSADINLIILNYTHNKIINKSFKPFHFWHLPSYVELFLFFHWSSLKFKWFCTLRALLETAPLPQSIFHILFSTFHTISQIGYHCLLEASFKLSDAVTFYCSLMPIKQSVTTFLFL